MRRPALLACVLVGCQAHLPSQPPQGLPVAAAPGAVVKAWAEPLHLPRGGGQAQILVRVQTDAGLPYPDVEVRLQSSTGRLYSEGRILRTDNRGMTRDRLTTSEPAVVTVTAGGSVFVLRIALGESDKPQ